MRPTIRLVAAIAGGDVPDVSLIGTTWMGEFATLGGFEPTPDTIDPAAFFEGAWNSTVVDGVSYGVPWYVETRLIYYRTDLAEEGGFNQAPANWDELTQLAEAMVEGGAEYGISIQPGGIGAWQTYMPFFWQAGGEIVDADNNFTLDSEACVASMTFYQSFFESELASSTVSDVPVEAQFADGTVGAFISGPWMIGIVNDAGADPESWTVAHQPTETAGTSFVGGGNLAVFAQADNKTAGWAFVEFASRPEVQVDVVRDGERPAGRAGGVGRRGARRGRAAGRLRRAAGRRQVAAGDPHVGADRLGDRRTRSSSVAVGEAVAGGRLRCDAGGGGVDRHRPVMSRAESC